MTPSPHHPLGAKGVGEPPTIAPAPAIVSGINDALRDLGIRFQRIPVTRKRLQEALRTAAGGNGKGNGSGVSPS